MATESTLRYLKTDYQAHKDALLQRIRSRWPNAWNDFLANSFGIVLVDLVAWSAATLAFLINRAAGENFIPTMTLRESAVRMGALVGYQLRGPVPASVYCEATLISAEAADVTISKGTAIRTSGDEAIVFEVAKDYTIEAGFLAPRTLVAQFSPLTSGAKVLNTYVKVTTGSVNADLVDTTIDLSQYVQAGQSFNLKGDSSVYTIDSLETAPGAAAANTRMVLSAPWAGSSGNIEAEVYDQRIQLIQGQTITDRFVAPADTNTNYSVKLSKTSVIDGTITVTVNGEQWTKVDSTALRQPEDKVFQVKTFVNNTSNEDTVVLFGDGRFGALVPSEASVQVSYRIGGGIGGNIALNTISTSVVGLVKSLNNPVSIFISNASSTGIGGQDKETLEEARINIPYYARTNDRAVTLDDYQTLAQRYSDPNYGSVAYARATIRTENSFLEGNQVVIYAWTTGASGGLVPLNVPLKQALKDYLQTKALGTDLVLVYDGSARPVPISLRFRTASGYSVVDTTRLVKDGLTTFIAALRPGQPVLYSNFLRTLDEVTGVDTVNMATPIADLIPSNSTELFTAPDDDYAYDIDRTGVGSQITDGTGSSISQYEAQLPIFPLAAWSLRMFIGSTELTVVPYVTPGYARIFGTNFSTDDNYPSTINLLTGKCSLWLKGSPGDLSMKLVSISGYSSERLVNVYVGYSGDNSATRRREIRSAIRAWGDGLSVGSSIYAKRVTGISASSVSLTDVVAAVPGVDSVTRVAIDTPANTQDRLVPSDFELLRIGTISINNQLD